LVTRPEGWLASRRLLRTRRVRTDLLFSVRFRDGVSPRLVFPDVFGDRVEIGPQVLLDHADIRHRPTEDARTSLANGTLNPGPVPTARHSPGVTLGVRAPPAPPSRPPDSATDAHPPHTLHP